MKPLAITENHIRAMTSEKVFQRGMEYSEDGSVLSVVRRGHALHAEVEGSDYEPYQIVITFEDGGDTIEADCSCPYGEEWDGWCKHIVATLLVAMNEPEAVEEQPSVAELLAPLNHEQLLELAVRLIERDAHLYAEAQEYIASGSLPKHNPWKGSDWDDE